MKKLLYSAFTVALLCIAAACDKAPKGVIPESTMEDLLVDIEMADAYIQSHWDQFPNDSSKLVLKQSVMAKYNVTPELYDTSLVWYARNMDSYLKVYDNVIRRLQDMRDEAADEASASPVQRNQEAMAASNHTYAMQGDSADLWHGVRRWVFSAPMTSGFVTFDLEPDREYAPGDRYEFQYKLANVRNTFRTFLAVDYRDGSTSLITNQLNHEGWNHVALQSDSTRLVSRIYGYIYYNMMRNDIAYADSLLLLRTHTTPKSMPMPPGRLIERTKPEPKPEPATSTTEAPKAAGHVASVIPNAPANGTFKPKEGVNKSIAQKHINESPNSKHLPSNK